MDITNNYQAIVSAIFVGLAAGYLGSFMVLRRMALVGDALSHVALPGVAIALLFNFNPFLGAFTTLFFGIIGIWLIEKKTALSTESLVGLFFTVSLSVGLLITPQEDILEALFGNLTKVTSWDMLIAIALSVFVIIVARYISRSIVLGTISKELAETTGVKVEKINFIFLLLVALVVALGIKVVGTILMGALVVIPAITSRNITTSFRSYSWGSGILGLVSAGAGVVLASYFFLSPGPVIVLTSGAIFLATLLFRK